MIVRREDWDALQAHVSRLEREVSLLMRWRGCLASKRPDLGSLVMADGRDLERGDES